MKNSEVAMLPVKEIKRLYDEKKISKTFIRDLAFYGFITPATYNEIIERKKYKYIIMGGHDGKRERIALEVESLEEALNRLNACMIKKSTNLWVDSLGQEFSIIRSDK